MKLQPTFNISYQHIKAMKVLIDNGHGHNTAGKRSPDGKLQEWSYTREIASRVVNELRRAGVEAELLVPEDRDVKLVDRCHRVNVQCQSLGASNVLLISIHCNAAGNGKYWMDASGWEAWTSSGQTEGDRLADFLYDAALDAFPKGTKIRSDWGDADYDKECQFLILSKTLCPAVLTENFFMDNKDDIAYMLSEEGKDAIVRCHCKGIIDYIEHA